MAKVKVLIVEDEELYAEQLEILIEELDYLCLGVVNNAQRAVAMAHATKPDIILMDVNIVGEKDGIEVAEMITEKISIPIIFITSQIDDETFARAKSTKPIAFITKPIHGKKLKRTIELTIERLGEIQSDIPTNVLLNQTNSKSIFIKVKDVLQKINIDDILYIEVMNRDCTVHCTSGSFEVRTSLGSLMEKLPRQNFIKVHRSFVINPEHISSLQLSTNRIFIGKNEIPISKANREELIQRLNLL